jgi:hypothetical protein
MKIVEISLVVVIAVVVKEYASGNLYAFAEPAPLFLLTTYMWFLLWIIYEKNRSPCDCSLLSESIDDIKNGFQSYLYKLDSDLNTNVDNKCNILESDDFIFPNEPGEMCRQQTNMDYTDEGNAADTVDTVDTVDTADGVIALDDVDSIISASIENLSPPANQ